MILNFDATQIEITNDFELIPDGTEAVAVITGSELKETRDGTGQYVNLKIEIIDGDYKGRVVFDILNIQNKNEKAMKIAYQTLAKICNAVGKTQIQSTEELHDIPMKIKIGVNKQEGYDPSNKVKNYSGVNDTPKEQPKATTPTTSAKKPWEK